MTKTETSSTLKDLRKRVKRGENGGVWNDARFTAIVNDADQLILDHAERDEIWQQLEDMYLIKSEKVPQGQDDYTTLSLKPHLAVGQLQDILCTTPAQVSVPEIGSGDEAKKEAERIRVALDAFMFRVEESGDEVLPQLVSQAAIFSRCVVKVLDRRRLWVYRGYSDKEISDMIEDGELPFLVTPVHPKGVYVRRLEDHIEYVVQRSRMRYSDITRFFGDKMDFLGDTHLHDHSETDVYEYWDDETQCTWINGVGRPIIGPMEHGSVNPFCVRDVRSGRYLGIADREGQSMLRPLLDGNTWHRENLILTLMGNNAYHLINQTFITYTKSGQPVTGDVSKPGGQIPMSIGESISPLRTGEIPEVVKMFQTYLESESDLALVPRVLSGNAPGGVTAGYAINILSQSARSKIASIQRAVERCYADALGKVLAIAKANDEDVPIWGKAQQLILKKTDLGKRRQIFVNLAARLPQDKMSDTQVALAMKQTRCVSDEHIAENVLELPWEREQERMAMEAFQKIVAPLHYLELARTQGYIKNDAEEDMVRTKLGLPLLNPPQPQGAPAGPPTQPGAPPSGDPGMDSIGVPPPELLAAMMGGGQMGSQGNPLGGIGAEPSSVFPAAETGLAPMGQDAFAAMAGGMGAPGGIAANVPGLFGV